MLNNKSGSQVVQNFNSDLSQQHILPSQLAFGRPDSPHGSEQSRYSGPMNTSYPSPTAMGGTSIAPMPNMGPASMSLPSLPPAVLAPHGMHTGPYKAPDAPQPPPKAYPCSTCGKGFARRSDLARHGKRFIFIFLFGYNIA